MKRIAIWSHPRSRSTALERAFIEREDFFVIHEPFSMSKYKGASENEVYSSIVNFNHATQGGVLGKITYTGVRARGNDNLIIKDFPYHSLAAFDALTYCGFDCLFLLRDPLETIISWQRIHPEFERDELGYGELLYAIRRVKSLTGEVPLVIRAEDLLSDPEEIMQRICLQLGIDFSPNMVRWKKRGDISAWGAWEKYHADAKESKGFEKKNIDDGKLTGKSKMFYETILPIYHEILKELESEVLE